MQLRNIELYLDIRVKQESINRDFLLDGTKTGVINILADFVEVYFNLLPSGNITGVDDNTVTPAIITGFWFEPYSTGGTIVTDLVTGKATIDYYETETAKIYEVNTSVTATPTNDVYLDKGILYYTGNDGSAEVNKMLLETRIFSNNAFAEDDPIRYRYSSNN